MFDGRWRGTVDRGTEPVGRKLQQWGVTADMLTATGLISATATAVAVATGHLHLAHHPAHPHRVPRPSRRPGGQGVGDIVDPRRLLRLGHRPGCRCADPRGRGLVPGVDPSRPSGPVAVRRARRHLLGLLPAGEGRVAGHLRPWRSHGAGRADDPVGNRLPLPVVPGPGPVGDVGPDHGNCGRAVHQGVAPGRGAGSGDRSPTSSPVPIHRPGRGPEAVDVAVPVEGSAAG